jgi:hypothetical protein
MAPRKASMTDRTPDTQGDSTKDENAEKDESVLEKAKDTLAEIFEVPEGADYDRAAGCPSTRTKVPALRAGRTRGVATEAIVP